MEEGGELGSGATWQLAEKAAGGDIWGARAKTTDEKPTDWLTEDDERWVQTTKLQQQQEEEDQVWSHQPLTGRHEEASRRAVAESEW